MKPKREPLKIDRPVDLRGMKSLNDLQRMEVSAYVEKCFEALAEHLQREHDRRYWRKPRWVLWLEARFARKLQ